MSSNDDNTTIKPQCVFASGAEALLAVKLFELRNRKASEKVQHDAIDTIARLVNTHDNDEDGSLKDCMVAMKGMETLVQAIMRPSASIPFLYRAAVIFVKLMEDSADRASSFIDCGGLDCCFQVMETFESDCALVACYVCVLMTMLFVVTNDQRVAIACTVMEKVVTVMERHGQDSSSLYFTACATIGLCYGPGVLIPVELWTRAVQCTFDGIVMLKDFEDAQTIGRQLLVHMIGPEAARQMIDHAEMHHCQDATCSCAA